MQRHWRRVAAAASALAIVFAAGACARAADRVQSPPAPLPPKPVNIPAAAPLRAGETFETISMDRTFTPIAPPGGTDEYRCFLVDPHVTTTTFLTGSQFIPSNGNIVHHAILYRVPASQVAVAKARDAREDGDGWTCFGGSGVGGGGLGFGQGGNDQAWIGAWAPGGHEVLLGTDTGYEMDPGSQIVMQIHYNLLATGGRPGEVDRSSVRLRLSTSSKIRPLRTSLVPAPIELPCTPQESGPLCDRTAAINDLARRFGNPARAMVAGLNLICNHGGAPVPGPTQHCDIPVRQAGTIYSVAGHMHLLGRSIRVELNPGTPRAQTLLDIPSFNFDDQAARPMARPVQVRPGDTYRVTCTYDAALRSMLPQLQTLKPRYVVWGDGTSDEMCLGIVVWTAA